MKIEVNPVEYADVMTLRDLYRLEANCQVRWDSMPSRRLADLYLVIVDGRTAGYGAVLNKYDSGRLVEFYALPHRRAQAAPMFRALLEASGATQIGAQTNIPLLLSMLYDYASEIHVESILFRDAALTALPCPGGEFRQAAESDVWALFGPKSEPNGDWVVAIDGRVAASGGFLSHYNPPYADLFMEVAEPMRRKSYGSYLVQEIKRACYEAGKMPAARCDPANIGSRLTLEKAGFLPCGRVLVGAVRILA